MKRVGDITLALLLFLPTFLFVLFLSLLIILINHFSPFYTSKRIGKNQKTFICYKLQTLQPPQPNKIQSSKERMTSLGEIYRDHGWDELPQILNILKGNMSFIGPRPIMDELYTELKEKFPNKKPLIDSWKEKRLQYLPGLSGWHQIHLPNHNIIKYDFEYFQKWTLLKSLQVILVSTLIVIVGKKRYFAQPIPSETYEYQI